MGGLNKKWLFGGPKEKEMTLDEAIIHAEEEANNQRECARAVESRWGSQVQGYSIHSKSAAEHEQLANWLKELKRYKESTDI